MLENRPKQVQNVILEKTCKNKSCRKLNFSAYTCLTHHHTLRTVYLVGRVELYPLRIPEHNFFIFGHFGSVDPKKNFTSFRACKVRKSQEISWL